MLWSQRGFFDDGTFSDHGYIQQELPNHFGHVFTLSYDSHECFLK